jgi:threonine dehydrogenase-like Zn-dependent dehydrogenase
LAQALIEAGLRSAQISPCDPRDASPAEAIRAATNGRGLDVALDFAGVPAVRERAAALLGIGGIMVLVGLTPRPRTVTDGIAFSAKGNQIRGHFVDPQSMAAKCRGRTQRA